MPKIETPIISESLTPNPTQTKKPTAPQIPTHTQKATETIFPSETPTWTSLPKLEINESYSELLQLFTNNGDCGLPCWWGITPGETLWHEVHETFSPLGDIYSTSTIRMVRYDLNFAMPDEVDTFDLGFFEPVLWVENDVVKAIGISSGWIKSDFDNSLAGILEELGQPDEVWVQVVTDTMDIAPYYYLDLFYPSKGILVGFQRSYAEQLNGNLNICPYNIYSLSPSNFPAGLIMWSPKENISYTEIARVLLGDLTGLSSDYFYPLEEIADNFDSRLFYETYRNSKDTTCIKIKN